MTARSSRSAAPSTAFKAPPDARRPHPTVDTQTRVTRRVEAALHEPGKAQPDTVLQLQRLGGNVAVRELLAERGIQARLTVGAAGDAYEQEADRVAETIAASPAGERVHGAADGPAGVGAIAPEPISSTITPVAQRHTPDPAPGDEEPDDDDEDVQRSSAGGREASFEAGAEIEATISRTGGGGRPLDATVQREMEARFGTSFGGVRVHDDAASAQVNRSIGANAFTRGRDIYVGAGQPDLASSGGRHLLAHELTHVVQQGGGRASAAVQRNVARGEQLPDLNEATGTKVAEALDTDPALRAMTGAAQLRKLIETLKTDAALRAFLGPTMATVSDAAIRDVRAAYLVPLRKAVAEVRQAAGAARSGRMVGKLPTLLTDVKTEVENEIYSKFSSKEVGERARIVVKLSSVGTDHAALARGVFDAARGDARLGPAYLPDDARASFAAALKQLPVVRLLTGPGGARMAEALGGQGGQGGRGAQQALAEVPEWKDGGKLADKVIVKASKGIPSWLSKKRERKQVEKFKAKVAAVDAWLRAVVEASILRRVPRPDVVMHTRGRMKTIGSTRRFVFLADPSGYRPNFSDGQVNLPYNETFALIAHEMGHAIEGYLPIKSWHDMNLLLERRHEEKMEREGTPGAREARTGATMWTSGKVNFGPLTNEGRYAGTYVTGKYTSTAYDDAGNAEVFSQGIEFLTKPAEALRLIEGDPQHAGIILRAIRPAEYAALGALRPFDKYLPIKGGG